MVSKERDNIQAIIKQAIRRLSRRGGLKRISDLLKEECCDITMNFVYALKRFW